MNGPAESGGRKPDVGTREVGTEGRPKPQAQKSRRWSAWLSSTIVIGAGGYLGANARYGLGLLIAARWGNAFPWGTLLINVSGSFLLGLFVTLAIERFSGAPGLRAFVATGFLGSVHDVFDV